MRKSIHTLFGPLLLSVSLQSCVDPDDLFLSYEELDFKTVFVYDAEMDNIAIDYYLNDISSKKPYKLTSNDGPITANWHGTETQLDRVATGQLSGVVPVDHAQLGELVVKTELVASPVAEVTTLAIADLPGLLADTNQDTEMLQIFWSPATVFDNNSAYLNNHTVQIALRNTVCGTNRTDFTLGEQLLDANSEYTSENTIATTVSYNAVVELLQGVQTTTNGQCELSVSLVTTRELANQPKNSATANNPVVVNTVGDRPWDPPSDFANAEDGTHTFTFYSQSVTFLIAL